MAKSKEQEVDQLRFGLAIWNLFKENRTKRNDIEEDLLYTIGKIASDARLRSATISDALLGKSNIKGSTLSAILKSLKKSMVDFGMAYDKITERDIYDFTLITENYRIDGIKKINSKNITHKKAKKQ